MLVPMGVMLKPAREAGYAVGAFDVNDLETAAGVLEAAVEKHSPVILAIPEWGPASALSMDELFRSLAHYAAQLPVPVALNLDHGRSLSAVVRAIQAGATSVMLDASTLTDEQNVALTARAVEIGHWAGVAVEGEIGHVGQGSEYASIDADRNKLFTQPDQAISFIEKTGVDALAVAVGTAHGQYVGTPRIDFDLLAELKAAVALPLVLHGGSSSGDENLHRASTLGVAKVNIYTDMAVEARKRIAVMLADKPDVPFMRLLKEAKSAFKEVSAHYMDVFGSTGRA